MKTPWNPIESPWNNNEHPCFQCLTLTIIFSVAAVGSPRTFPSAPLCAFAPLGPSSSSLAFRQYVRAVTAVSSSNLSSYGFIHIVLSHWVILWVPFKLTSSHQRNPQALPLWNPVISVFSFVQLHDTPPCCVKSPAFQHTLRNTCRLGSWSQTTIENTHCLNPPAGLLWAIFSYLAPRLYQPPAVVEHLELEIIHWMVQYQKFPCPNIKSVSYISWPHPIVPINSHHVPIKQLNVFPYPHRILGLLVALIHFPNSYSVDIPFIVHNIENGISHNAVNPTMNRSQITKKSCIKYPQNFKFIVAGLLPTPQIQTGKTG